MSWDSDNFIVLDEYEFLEFFEVEPVEKSIEDGYWCYELLDSNQVQLRFSFNVFEKSIQTEISMNDKIIMTTSYEGDVKMSLRDNMLYCEFIESEKKTVLTVSVKDFIKVDWSTIVIS
jgi:hypothetical protein